MMNSYLLYSILDRCIDTFFSGIQSCTELPSYKGAKMRDLVGSRIPCMWMMSNKMDESVLYRLINVDVSIYLKTEFLLEFDESLVFYNDSIHNSSSTLIVTDDKYVWISDDSTCEFVWLGHSFYIHSLIALLMQ